MSKLWESRIPHSDDCENLMRISGMLSSENTCKRRAANEKNLRGAEACLDVAFQADVESGRRRFCRAKRAKAVLSQQRVEWTVEALHKQGRRLHNLLVNFGKVQCSQQIIISGWRTTLEKWEFNSPEEVPLQLWRRYREMLDSCRFCPLCQERCQVIRIIVGRRLLLENDRQNRTNRTTLCLLTWRDAGQLSKSVRGDVLWFQNVKGKVRWRVSQLWQGERLIAADRCCKVSLNSDEVQSIYLKWSITRCLELIDFYFK